MRTRSLPLAHTSIWKNDWDLAACGLQPHPVQQSVYHEAPPKSNPTDSHNSHGLRPRESSRFEPISEHLTPTLAEKIHTAG